MNIGILTQPLKDNYGGVIQNYALQETLRRMGHNPITLDIGASEYPIFRWMLTAIKQFVTNPFQLQQRKLPSFPFRNRYHYKNTGEFIHKYIKLSSPINVIEESITDNLNIEVLIVGSDQVWRPRYNPKNQLFNMFLDFAYNKEIIRIAYAASFGTNIWEFTEDETQKCKTLIKKFNAVSVRENSAQIQCKKHWDIEPFWAIDPTLLLSKEDYNHLCDSNYHPNETYILCYILDISDTILEQLDSLEKKAGIKIIKIHDNDTKYNVIKWLTLFQNAQFVITDSFHGTVFSIIFNKSFCTIGNKTRGNDRINSLLERLHLTNRFIDINSIHNIVLNESINWEETFSYIDKWRSESIIFLTNAIRDEHSF